MGDVPQGGGAASPQPGLTALVTDAAGFIDPCGFRTIRERAPPTCGPVSPSSRSGDPVDHALGACVGHAGCAGQCFPRDGSRPTGPIVAFRTEHTSTWVRIPAGAKPSALHGGKATESAHDRSRPRRVRLSGCRRRTWRSWGAAASLGLCGVAHVVLLELPGPRRGTCSQVSRTACGTRRRSRVKPRSLPGAAEGMSG